MLRVNVTLPVKPGSVPEFLDLARRLAAAARAEAGCVSYEVGQDVRNAASIVLLEAWESQGALTAHMATDAFRDLTARMVPLHAGEPTYQLCEVVG